MFLLDDKPLTFKGLYRYYETPDDGTGISKQGLMDLVIDLPLHGTSDGDEKDNGEIHIALEDMQGFKDALVDAFPEEDDKPKTLETLVARINLDDSLHTQIAMQLWWNLWQEAFRFEGDPLALLTTFIPAIETPVQMCAAVCVLIENDIPVDVILSSLLLQAYGARYEAEPTRLRQLYELFGKHVFREDTAKDAQQELLQKVARIAIEPEEGSKHADEESFLLINGDAADEQYTEYDVLKREHRFSWEMDDNRLSTLIHWLGGELAIECILKKLSEDDYPILQASLFSLFDDALLFEPATRVQHSLKGFLRDSPKLAEMFQRLSVPQLIAFVRTMERHLPGIMTTYEIMVTVCCDLNIEKFQVVLNGLSAAHLNQLISSPTDLQYVLTYFDEDNSRRLLQAIQQHLPAILKGGYEGNHRELVQGFLFLAQRYQGRLFDSASEPGSTAAGDLVREDDGAGVSTSSSSSGASTLGPIAEEDEEAQMMTSRTIQG